MLWEIAQGYSDNPFIDSPAEKTSPKKLSRREFGIACAVLVGMGLGISRVVDIETKGRRYDQTMPQVLRAAAKYKQEMRLGLGADFPNQYEKGEKHDPWLGTQSLREKAGKLNSIVMFANLEDFEETWTVRDIRENLIKINEQGALPVLSVHMYSKPNGKHPFDINDEQAMARMAQYAHALRVALDGLPFKIEIRLFYEMNLPFVFSYSRGNGLSNQKQMAGYKHVIEIFFKELQQANPEYPRPLAFSPSVINPQLIPYYWVNTIKRKIVFPRIGGDYYDIFPGSIEAFLARHPDLSTVIKWLPLYFAGRVSPDDTLGPALAILQKLAKNGTKTLKHEMVIFEIGSLTDDLRLLQYAELLAASYGVSEVDPFGRNKLKEAAEKPFEKNWLLTALVELMYAKTTHVLDDRVLAPHKVTASGLYIAS